MASKTKKKGKKKSENVDIGIFGWPSDALLWIAKQRGSKPRLIAMKAVQAIIGLIIASSMFSVMETPYNAASITLMFGFVLGSVIGSPFSFLLWTLFLSLISGFLAGIIADAWLYSPSYWRGLASEFENGGSLPGWFLFAGPLLFVIWVAGSRGVAKGSEMVLNFLANKLKRTRNDHLAEMEKEQYEQFYKNTDVSPSESRALLGDQGDGTIAVMTASPSKVSPIDKNSFVDLDEVEGSPVSLAKSDDMDKMDYDALLSGVGIDPESDPDVIKAAGISASISFDDNASSESESSKTETIEVMESVSLPSIPTENAPVIARSNHAAFNPKKNRPLFRRMETLMMDFEKSQHEDDEDGFTSRHRDELIALGEEQLQVLESLENSGPLLAIIAEARKQSANDFLVGKAQSPLPDRTGSVDFTQASDDESAEEEVIPDDVRERNLDEAMRIADEVNALESDLSKALGKRVPFPEMASAHEENSDLTAETSNGEFENEFSSEDPSDIGHHEETQIISNEMIEVLSNHDDDMPENHAENEADANNESDNSFFGFDVVLQENINPLVELAANPSEPEMSVHSDSVIMNLVKTAFEKKDFKLIASDVDFIESRFSGVKVSDVINSIAFQNFVSMPTLAHINHLWPEVKKLLHGSVVEDFKAELAKIKHLANKMLEAPHLMEELKVSKLEADFNSISKKAISNLPIYTDLTDDIRETGLHVYKMKDYIKSRKDSEIAAAAAKSAPAVDVKATIIRGREKGLDILSTTRETGDIFGHSTKSENARPSASMEHFLIGPASEKPSNDTPSNVEENDEVSDDEIDFSLFSCHYEVGSKAYEVSREAFVRMQKDQILLNRKLVLIEQEEARKEAARKEAEALRVLQEADVENSSAEDPNPADFETVSLDTPSSFPAVEEIRIKLLTDMAEDLKKRQQSVIDLEKNAAEEKLRKEKAEADQAESRARAMAAEAAEKENDLKNKIEEIENEKASLSVFKREIEDEKEKVSSLKAEFEKKKEELDKISSRSISPSFDEAVFDFAHSFNKKAKIPPRFQKKKIISSLISTTRIESRPVMSQFSSKVSVNPTGELNIEEIALSPYWQSFYMNKLEVANEYRNVLNMISDILDIPSDSSFDDYRNLLEEPEHAFFGRVWTEASQIDSVTDILKKVEDFNSTALQGLKNAEIIKEKDIEISSMGDALASFREKVEKLEAELAQKHDDVMLDTMKDLEETKIQLAKANRRIKDLENRSKGLIFDDELQDFLDNQCFSPPEFENFKIPGIYAFKANNGAIHIFLTMKQNAIVSGFDPVDPENFSPMGPEAFVDKVNNISLHRKAKIVFTNNLDSYFPLSSEKNVFIKREEFNPSNFE